MSPANKIFDEFTGLPLSRQRKWQLRKRRDKKCLTCGVPVFADSLWCARHLELRGEYTRRLCGWNPWQPGKRGRPPKNLAKILLA